MLTYHNYCGDIVVLLKPGIKVTAKTERNINKHKPSVISVLEISEKSTSDNEKMDCDHQHQQKVLENIDLSGLTYHQREQV